MVAKIAYKYLSHPCHRLLVIGLLAVITLGGSGCGKDEAIPEVSGKPVLMNISTRALNAGTTDGQINTVRVLLANKRNIGRSIDRNVFVNSPADPLIIQVDAGEYDVYVVANETTSGEELSVLQNVRILNELKEVTLPFSVADRNFTNIPMFGEVADVTITPSAGEASSANLARVSVAGEDKGTTLPVTLIRMACKLSLTLKRGSGTLKEVRLTNLPDAIPLFPDHFFTPGTRPVKTLVAGTFTLATGTETLYPQEASQQDILLPSWVFADLTSKTEAVRLEADVTETNGDVNTYSNPIGHDIASPNYTLWRNHAYTLTARILNNTMTVTAKVVPWTEETLDIEDDNPVIPDDPVIM